LAGKTWRRDIYQARTGIVAMNSDERDEKKEVGETKIEQDETKELDNRLEELEAKLTQMTQQSNQDQQAQQGNGASASGLAMAWRLGSEFIAGVFVGGAIGWLIDKWFGLAPWGLIIFILLGFLAGMLNMLRSAGKISPPGE
jgi:ATP synthase protein I